MPQIVVVVQVFVPQRQSVDTLGEQFLHGMLDPVRIAVICETSRELTNDPGEPLRLPQQKPAAVRGDATTVSKNLPLQQVFSHRSQSFSRHLVRNAG